MRPSTPVFWRARFLPAARRSAECADTRALLRYVLARARLWPPQKCVSPLPVRIAQRIGDLPIDRPTPRKLRRTPHCRGCRLGGVVQGDVGDAVALFIVDGDPIERSSSTKESGRARTPLCDGRRYRASSIKPRGTPRQPVGDQHVACLVGDADGGLAASITACGVTRRPEQRHLAGRMWGSPPYSGLAMSAMPIAAGSPKWIGAPCTRGKREVISMARICVGHGEVAHRHNHAAMEAPGGHGVEPAAIGTRTFLPCSMWRIGTPASSSARLERIGAPQAKADQVAAPQGGYVGHFRHDAPWRNTYNAAGRGGRRYRSPGPARWMPGSLARSADRAWGSPRKRTKSSPNRPAGSPGWPALPRSHARRHRAVATARICSRKSLARLPRPTDRRPTDRRPTDRRSGRWRVHLVLRQISGTQTHHEARPADALRKGFAQNLPRQVCPPPQPCGTAPAKHAE